MADDRSSSDAPVATTVDRRAFLRKAGLVGGGVAGAVWVAPSMLGLDSVWAAGSCAGGGTLHPLWNTSLNNTRVLDNAGVPAVAASGITGGIDVKVTAHTVNNVAGNGLAWNNWKVRTSNAGAATCGGNSDYPMGTATNFYSLEMAGSTTDCTAAGTANRSVSVTFGFYLAGTNTPANVRQLVIPLLDIDTIAGDYRDQVTVSINGNTSANPASTGTGGTFPTVALPPGTDIVVPTPGVATYRGNTDASSGDTTGNVTLTSNTTTNISSVTITFTDVLNGGPGTIQWVGIGALTFCKV